MAESNTCACGVSIGKTAKSCRKCHQKGNSSMLQAAPIRRKQIKPDEVLIDVGSLLSSVSTCSYCFRKGRWPGAYCPEHAEVENQRAPNSDR